MGALKFLGEAVDEPRTRKSFPVVHPALAMLHLLDLPLLASLIIGGSSADFGSTAAVMEASAPRRAAVPAYAVTALMRAPEKKLGETLSMAVQFHGEVENWNPFLSRFDPVEYRCVTVWADEQWLWIKEEYDSPSAHFFVRRGTMADAMMAGAKAHDRFLIDAVVREMHAGKAWIEVTEVVRTEEQTPEGTVLHAISAIKLIEREGWALAVSELNRALKPTLPGHVRRELEQIRDRCQQTMDDLKARRIPIGEALRKAPLSRPKKRR